MSHTQGRITFDTAPDANGFTTLRPEDGTEHGDTEAQPIATVYKPDDAAKMKVIWNAFEPGGLVARMAEALADYHNLLADHEKAARENGRADEAAYTLTEAKAARVLMDEYKQAKGGE